MSRPLTTACTRPRIALISSARLGCSCGSSRRVMPGVRQLCVMKGEVMKARSLALLILLIASPFAMAQDGGAPEAQPFVISSLNTAFAVQGDFAGEYRVYPDRIELRVTKADISISEHCPYKGRRLLSGVKFGLAVETDDKRWKIETAAQEFTLERVMSPGDTHNLGELYFYIPKDDSVDMSKRWLVAQMADIALDVPEEKRGKGHAFAHSRRDIFTHNK